MIQLAILFLLIAMVLLALENKKIRTWIKYQEEIGNKQVKFALNISEKLEELKTEIAVNDRAITMLYEMIQKDEKNTIKHKKTNKRG